MTFRCMLVTCLLACGLAHAQVNNPPKHCVSPSDVILPGQSYYPTAKQDICMFNYRVPQARQAQLLRENLQCKGYGAGVVNCSTAVAGNYGQVRFGLGAPAVAANNGQVRSGPGAPAAAANNEQVPFRPGARTVSPEGPTRPDGNGRPVVYPETTLAHMTFPPTRTAEEIMNMAVEFESHGQHLQQAAAYLKCSEMGNIRCTSSLGQMYDVGDSVPLDRARALSYLQRGAEAGNRGAQYTFGMYYEEGEVIPKDIKKALEWYTKSANQGSMQGERHLGFAYEFADLGLPHDRPKAIEWLSKSAAQGDEESEELVQILRSPNTPARFRDPDAFSAYYASLIRARFPAGQTPAAAGGGVRYDPYFDHNSSYWRERGRSEPIPHN
jgi:TPR repeat protein